MTENLNATEELTLNTVIEIPNFEELLNARAFNAIRELAKNASAADLADFMEPMHAEKEAVIFRLLPREQAAMVFSYLPAERQEELLKAMANEEVAGMLNAMSDDDRTDLLEELPAEVTQKLLNLLSQEVRTIASKLLVYAEESVGRLMSPHFVRIRSHWTIAYALDHIRRYGKDSETMSMIYVIDNDGKLIDDLRIRSILLAQT